MPLVNRAPIDPVTGLLTVTTTVPTAAWPSLGGMTYDPATGALAVIDAVPAVNDPWNGGIRFTNVGQMYVTTVLPAPIFYVGGLPVSTDGRMFFSSSPPVGSVGGWPIAADGGVAGSGLAPVGPVPIFFAPLTNSLIPTTAGNPAFTFTRATLAYATGVAPGGNAVDGEVLILCDINEARFQGARRVSSGVWSALYADGSAIPAAKLLGYVAENAATNICLQSQTFDNATWTKTLCTIAANAQSAPDGTQTADLFTDNATNAGHRVTQTPLTFTAAPYTFSCYVKQGTLPWVQLLMSDSSTTFWGNVNLATGAVGNKHASVTVAVTTLANGWFRVAITGTTLAASGSVGIYSILTDQNLSAPAYVGTGQTMYLWGAQVEQASDPSSYIPTTTVAGIRNVDSLTYPVLTNIDGATATAYSECWMRIQLPAVNRHVLRWPSPSLSILYYRGSDNICVFENPATAIGTSNPCIYGATNKAVSAWSGTTTSACLNGGTVATGAFSAFSTSGNIAVSYATAPVSGSIRNVKFYNVRIADVDLVAMTGP